MKLSLMTILTLVSFGTLAGTQVTLPLKGNVALLLGIEVTPMPVATALDLTQSQINLKVATGSILSNSSTGFKVTVSSANQGRLKRTSSANYFPYTMKFGAVDVALTSPTATVFTYPDPLNYTDNITVSYTGVPVVNLLAGDYVDTVTFTISAL